MGFGRSFVAWVHLFYHQYSLALMLMATSCLSSISCKGSSLWGWCGHSDPPVILDWSSSKIKVLGVFVAIGDWDDDNWHPCIDAVHHVLKL